MGIVIDDSDVQIVSIVPERRTTRRMMSIQIHELVEQFGGKPFTINCGECYEFADMVQERVGGIRLNIDLEDGPQHGWLYWGGRHYDAESPGGEREWRRLNIFQRWEVRSTEKEE